MDGIGYSNSDQTIIRAIIDGEQLWIPDDMANRYRRRIWDEWEMAPAPDGTPDDERVRVNTIPPHVEPPAPVPAEISRRQFFQILAMRELITQAEALAAVTSGLLPDAIQALIEQIVDDTIQWQVRMSFTAGTFRRDNWAVEFFGTMNGMTAAEIDQLWRDASVLD